MDSSKLAIKFFLDNPSDLKPEDFIPVFHRWIQTRALDGHQLIDVADYGHVQEGPGTVLVSHEANIHADLGGGRLGLLYIRKSPLPGSYAERLRAVLGYTIQAAALLESEPTLAGKIKFNTQEIVLQINDRLLAPNTQQTFEQIKGDAKSVIESLFETTSVELTYQPDPLRLFEVHIRIPRPIPLTTLRDRVG
jgi:hypothetical protein